MPKRKPDIADIHSTVKMLSIESMQTFSFKQYGRGATSAPMTQIDMLIMAAVHDSLEAGRKSFDVGSEVDYDLYRQTVNF